MTARAYTDPTWPLHVGTAAERILSASVAGGTRKKSSGSNLTGNESNRQQILDECENYSLFAQRPPFNLRTG
jgi:hypothetical protein